jgi:formylglycine-generating enzyme required for sulfatase activity
MRRTRDTAIFFLAHALLAATYNELQADVRRMGPDLTGLRFVFVGDEGNSADFDPLAEQPDPGYGTVGYAYRIGKYEVTSAQYTEFLNAVAKTDTFSLYNPEMWNDPYGCKIERTGSAGSYVYQVEPDRANRPVNFVNFWDSVRFVNWLHNGQPTGFQNGVTTERGAYQIDGYTGEGGASVQRQSNAKFWLPSEHEWYKAAYYDPVAGQYWDYPTGTNALPDNDLPDAGNNANFLISPHEMPLDYAIGDPYWRTEVGAYSTSVSPYGTYDQGGNVFEWNEATFYTDIFPPSFSFRGMRGGSWNDPSGALLAWVRYYPQVPNTETYLIGFRVATVIPEPNTAVLTNLAAMLIFPARGRYAMRRAGDR